MTLPATSLDRLSHPRIALGTIGVAAGAGLIALLAVAGALGSSDPSAADVRQAYQDGFAAGLREAPAATDGAVQDTGAETAEGAAARSAPAKPPPRSDVRLLPEARSGQLVEVNAACFQSPVLGCEEIY